MVAAVKPDIALDLLHDCLSSGGRIIPGKHFRDELKAEGLTLVDAWHVLRHGCIFDPPEHDVRTGEWKYRVVGLRLTARKLESFSVSNRSIRPF